MSDVAVAPQLPVSPFAKRAGLFALLILPVNVVSNLLGRLLDNEDLATSAGPGYAIASVLFVVFVIAARLVVIALAFYSLYNAKKAFADFRTGAYSGRGRTIVSIIWSVGTLALAGYSLFVIGVQFVTGIPA